MSSEQINIAVWDNEQHRRLHADRMPIVPSEYGCDIRVSIERVDDDDRPSRVRLQNLGAPCELTWHQRTLELGEEAIVTLPLHLVQNEQHLELRQYGQLTASNRPLHTIERSRAVAGEALVSLDRLGVAPGAETLSRWFAALESLQHSSAGSQAFFQSVARAATNPGGMTAGFVILRDGTGWRTVGSHVPDPTLGICFCYDLLERVVADGRTHYHDALEAADDLPDGADSVVAAPLLDAANEVVGVVYGYRSIRSKNKRRSIRALEALWMQILAGSVSAALSRMKAEAEAARQAVLLEQAFSPQVIREITNNPAALAGRERETTILFADLRNSTGISESLSATENYELLSELLDGLSLVVRDQDGVIIDYYGDGMAAMWNAPTDQPDHARLACEAALAMQRSVKELNKDWQEKLGQPIRVGIGINTGHVRVGNAGSRTRLKYGPRGTSVIVASRLESATKHLGRSILITRSTMEQLGQPAVVQRLCQARLAGLTQPVEVYELHSLQRDREHAGLIRRIDRYEAALSLFEQGNLQDAEALLNSLTADHDESSPTCDISFLKTEIEGRLLSLPAVPSETGIIDLA